MASCMQANGSAAHMNGNGAAAAPHAPEQALSMRAKRKRRSLVEEAQTSSAPA